MLQSLFKDAKIFLILSFASFLLLLSDNIGILVSLKSTLQRITIPIQYGLYKTSSNAGKQFEFIFLVRKSVQENRALKEQLASVISENSALRKKLAETQALLVQQNHVGPQTWNLVSARPIGITRYLLIDKGVNNGLKVNQSVIFKDNLIGVVKEVSQRKAQILLVTDPDFRIAAFVSNVNGRARGVLTGQFGSETLLDKVLQQEPAEVGDLVYSEGTEEERPRGLILGVVTEVLGKDNQVFKQAKVKPLVDAKNLDVVFIITN